MSPIVVWKKNWQYRQVLRVEDGNVHWRNLGGKNRVSTLKNFTKWMEGAELLNLDRDVPWHVLESLGATWAGPAFCIDAELIDVCELDGRFYIGRVGGDYSSISREFYDAFVKEFACEAH